MVKGRIPSITILSTSTIPSTVTFFMSATTEIVPSAATAVTLAGIAVSKSHRRLDMSSSA
ncbi:hypothetical protein [Fibrobacter sp. UWOV1]|uniref:hypothetical protein n=1 Tax=Fibrobacter sp. UWOV1 TaxID=1896215 RepID=UPI0011149676|nr:hypothetical protein [Fibrobacter sp. UWOV1]